MTGLEWLREATVSREQSEASVLGAVIQSRREGASWVRIARVLGVSRQAASQRYGQFVK